MSGRAKYSAEESSSIGERLAAIRKERGITQVELAERLGVTQAAVSAYEIGKARLIAPMLLRIAQILGASTDEILGLKNGKTHRRLSRKVLRRVERIEGLPQRDQQALFRTIDAFIQRQPAGGSR